MKTWRDRERHRLEEYLGKAVVVIEEIVEITRRREEEYERIRQERLIEERRQLRKKRLDLYYRWAEDDLEKKVEDWIKAQLIRNFLAEYELRIADAGFEEKHPDWKQSAARYAESIDPMNKLDQMARDMEPSDEVLEEMFPSVKPNWL